MVLHQPFDLLDVHILLSLGESIVDQIVLKAIDDPILDLFSILRLLLISLSLLLGFLEPLSLFSLLLLL